MIRRIQESDIDTVAAIWLDTNIQTHHFIPEQYWRDNYEVVKRLFLQAEVYVYEDEGNIQGFVGLNGEYIAGIFVRSEARSRGIGRKLLDYIKDIKGKLKLNVYIKNIRAVSFYQREGFKLLREDMDRSTGETEYVMIWKKEEL